MGCLVAVILLAMAGGGGYGWYATHHFLWWGPVCLTGIVGLLIYMCVLTKGGAGIDGVFDSLSDINFD